MALETSTYISGLVATNPASSDNKSQGDDHLRLLKSTILATFPNISGAVTPTHTQLNTVPDLAPKASPTFTGTPAAPTATAGDSSTQIATTAFVAGTAFSSALPAQTGNSGKIITTDGSNASWTAVKTFNGASLLGSGDISLGIVLLATLTPTAAANLDFLTTFTSSYDNYMIVGDGITPSADNNLAIRLAVAGASDTGSNYSAPLHISSSTTTVAYADVINTVESTGMGANFKIYILNANSTTGLKSISVEAVCQNAATPGWANNSASYAYFAANAVSGFRLYWTAAANFAAVGKVRVYGYSNS